MSEVAPVRVVVHGLDCYSARGLPMVEARRVDSLAHPHGCNGSAFTGRMVRVEEVPVEPHSYAVSMIWPAGEPSPRCRACRLPKLHVVHESS